MPTPVPVVGRRSEREALRAALDAAGAGTGAVVLVTGPAGIGKTRMLEVLADDAAAARTPVVWARCPAEQGAPPLWPWQRALDASGAGAAEVDVALASMSGATPEDTAATRLLVYAAVTDALVDAAAPAGLVVVLEDLHWADAASLGLLRHLAADVRRSRLLVVGSARDGGGTLADGLAELVPQPGVELVPLAPLTVAGVAAYLSAAAGQVVDPAVVALVHERSGGNPLYVRTLARVLGPDLLDSAPTPGQLARRLLGSTEVRHLVAAVLRPLDEPVRQLLRVAGVLGEEVQPELLGAVAELPGAQVEAHLDAAGAAGLLTAVPDAPGRLRFAHALVRDGVLAELAEADRRRWHARAAAVLEQRAAEQPDLAGQVAFHGLRGAAGPEQLQAAVRWARSAAGRAAPYAPEEAARLLAAALPAAAGIDLAQHAELLVELAAAEYRAGWMTTSLEHSRQAAEVAELTDRPDLLAAAALVLRGVGHPATAAVLVELSERALRRGPHPPATQARLLAQRALADAELGLREPARNGALQALEAAESCGDPRAVLAAVHAAVDTLDCLGPPAERRGLADRALAVAPAAGQPLARLWALLWRLDAAYQEGEPAAVTQELARIEALVADNPLPLARWHLLRVRAARAALLGRLDEARAANEEAGALAVALQDPAALGMSSAFRLCMAELTGDPADLGENWLQSLHDAPDIPILTACTAVAMLLMERPEEARLLFHRVLPQAPDLPRDGRWRGTMDALVEVSVRLRDVAAAELLYELLLPGAAWSGGAGAGNMWTRGSGWRQVAEVAAVAGHRDAAVAAFERALDADVYLGARPDAVHVRLGLAELLAEDDAGRARALATEAAAEARRIGMPGPLRRADRLLGRLTTARADPLTVREREVAELVAQSLSNREVAERLVLSERTVESHVRSILAKLALSRRTDVVRWVLVDRAGA